MSASNSRALARTRGLGVLRSLWHHRVRAGSFWATRRGDRDGFVPKRDILRSLPMSSSLRTGRARLRARQPRRPRVQERQRPREPGEVVNRRVCLRENHPNGATRCQNADPLPEQHRHRSDHPIYTCRGQPLRKSVFGGLGAHLLSTA